MILLSRPGDLSRMSEKDSSGSGMESSVIAMVTHCNVEQGGKLKVAMTAE